MRILFCVDSYFQLMGAISLRQSLFGEYAADLIIYNTTPTAERVYERIKRIEVFEKVYIAKTRLALVGDNVSKIKKIPKYFDYVRSVFSPETVCEEMLGSRLIHEYDMLFFHGYGAILECVFNVCLKYNNNLKCYRLDDGLGTYLGEWSAPKWKTRRLFENIFYPLCNFRYINDYVAGYYVADPNLMTFSPPYSVYKSPKIDRNNSEYVNIMNYIFDYKPEQYINKAKIIYFGTWGDGVQSDLDVLSALKKSVGSENILIKVHPREDTEKYGESGIKIIDRSDVPWEVIMMNIKTSKMDFITLDSSAVFMARLYFDRGEGKDFYCYNCSRIVKQRLKQTMGDWIELNMKQNKTGVINVPRDIDELLAEVKDTI